MENYIIWGAAVLDDRLALLVTRVNLQRIARGTPAFVRALLEELGIQAEAAEWSIDAYFITNYLTDDPESEEWEDSWSETWDFRIPVDLAGVELPAPDDLRRTAWYDETAGDEELTFPVPLVMFAEFVAPGKLEAAASELEQLFAGAGRGGPADSAALRAAIDALPEEQRAGLRANVRGPLLQMSLGTVQEDFPEQSKQLRTALKAWIEARDGRTTWDERHT
ncbi:MAG TPA: hypothetical protein VF432_09305 [Thermoanaerobaculia bacterium]